MLTSMDYLRKNYITLSELAQQSATNIETLRMLQQAECLPRASYCVKSVHQFTSFFGDYEETEETEYYPKAYIALVRETLSSEEAYASQARTRRKAFESAYRRDLLEKRACEFGMAQYFKEDGSFEEEALKVHVEQEWKHYLDGIYGLCTVTASAKAIAMKEIMSARIKYLSERHDVQPLNDEELAALERGINQYDGVAAQFAPHEFERSSRRRYVNDTRAKFGFKDPKLTG